MDGLAKLAHKLVASIDLARILVVVDAVVIVRHKRKHGVLDNWRSEQRVWWHGNPTWQSAFQPAGLHVRKKAPGKRNIRCALRFLVC